MLMDCSVNATAGVFTNEDVVLGIGPGWGQGVRRTIRACVGIIPGTPVLPSGPGENPMFFSASAWVPPSAFTPVSHSDGGYQLFSYLCTQYE